MPGRRSRSNDLRAMEAYRRIHATLEERVVLPPDDPAREKRLSAPPPRSGRAARPVPADRAVGDGRWPRPVGDGRWPRPVRDARWPRPGRSDRRGRTSGAGGSVLGRGTAPLRSRGPSRFPTSDRPRPAGPVLTATAVIALLALLALGVGRLVVGSGSTPTHAAGSGAGGTSATTHTTTNGSHTANGTGTAHTAAVHSPSRAGGAGSGHPTAPAAGPVVTPQNQDATGASYLVHTASFSVVVSTGAAACWIEVGPNSGGPFSFVGTVPPGQQKTFPGAGHLWVRLGAPGNVTVAVDGTPLQLQAPGSSPYNLTFTSAGT